LPPELPSRSDADVARAFAVMLPEAYALNAIVRATPSAKLMMVVSF
jgi:hypothetical protein